LSVHLNPSRKDSVKYIGMDVRKEAISIAALNSSGKTYWALTRNKMQLICRVKATLCWTNHHTKYVRLHAYRNSL